MSRADGGADSGSARAPDWRPLVRAALRDGTRPEEVAQGLVLTTIERGERIQLADARALVDAEAERLADGRCPVVRSLAEILADPAALELPTTVIPRLAWRGRVTLLAAREKSGKSTVAGAAAAYVTRGHHWLGDATMRGPVLVVALEEHVGEVAARLEEWGADPERVYIVESLAGVADPLAALRQAVEDVAPVLLVVDTLAALVDHLSARPDPGSSTHWTPIMAALTRIARDTDAAVLLLHHARKSDGQYRDSSAIGAGVDVIVEMGEDGTDADVRRMRVRARWRVGDYAVRLLAGDDRHPAGRYELASGELSMDARVLLYVERHPGASGNAIRGGVAGRNADIDGALRRLLATGAIEDRGTAARPAYHVTGGARSGARSGGATSPAENPHGRATGEVSGRGLDPLGRPDPASLGRGLRGEVAGTVPDADPDDELPDLWEDDI